MPIVDLAQPDLTTPVSIPKGFAVTPGAVDVDQGSDATVERPAWSSTMSAAFRQDNTVGSYFAASERDAPTYAEPGFNPWDVIKSTKYEPFWESFVDVRNPRAAEAKKRQIDQEIEDRKTLQAAPWWQSLPSQMVAGVVDLPTLLPGGAFVRGVSGGVSVARSMASVGLAAGVSTLAQETALQAMQETRPLSESAVNVGASVLLGGLLGAGGARLLSKAEWSAAVKALDAELAGTPVPGTAPAAAGAAAVEPADLAGNTIAGTAAGAVAAATARLNPALRILQSPSAATREIGTKLFENSIYLKKNFDGVASEPAVETLMKEWNAGLAAAVRATGDTYPEYRRAGGQLSREEFRNAVGRAMRRGDVDTAGDPHVMKVAQAWRSQVFDPLKEAAIDAKLLPPDVSVETAASYFSRMWNRNKLIAQEGRFKAIVTRWVEDNAPKWAEAFDKDTIAKTAKLKDDALRDFQVERRIEREAMFGDVKGAGRSVANNVFDTLTGKTPTSVRPEFITITARGPLKERTFNIPDELVEEFLESDVDLVGRRYTRVMGADVELAHKFGSPDMTEQIQKVRDDYQQMRRGLTDEKQLMRLGKQEEADVRDLEALRDFLRGTRNENPIERNFGRVVRSFNHLNYLRSMGEVVLASLTDAVRPAMVHGLGAYMGGLAQLATNMKAIKLSVNEAQLAGNVAERVLGHRLVTMAEITDPYASRGPVEALLESMTNVASKWNGIRIWTDGMQSIASVMTQNRILKGVERFGTIKDREKAYLAYLGIDQSMAERIAKQFADHGETMDGVRVANTEQWTDRVVVRAYRAAMNKDVDSIIVQKSVADVPLFASTATGKAMLQFKTFALASHQKILLRGLQEDRARFVGGLVAMTMMGMFITYMKALSGNRPEVQEKAINNPGWWIGEGLDRSGVLSVPMELANIFEKAAGVNPLKSPLKAFDTGAGISQKLQNRNLTGSIAGPSAGLLEDAATTLGIPNRALSGEEITKGQWNAFERVLPFNSYLGIRQMLRYVVNPQD